MGRIQEAYVHGISTRSLTICYSAVSNLTYESTFSLSAMTMILTIYVAVSVTFSAGFVAGAWWASRSCINESSSLEVETIDRRPEPGPSGRSSPGTAADIRRLAAVPLCCGTIRIDPVTGRSQRDEGQER